jgi:type IV pilus assembly protein PilB
MAKSQKKLGEILVEWGTLKAAEITRGLDHARAKGMRLGEALIDLKLATEAQVYKALAQQQNMEYIDLEKSSIPPNAVNLIPDDLMKKYIIVPLGKEGNRLRVAIHDPLDFEMLEILRFRVGMDR